MMDIDLGRDPLPILSNGFQNGFRYYIHGVDEVSYLSHEGISVSPGYSVDSALGPNKVGGAILFVIK
ncbi:unnamed protein product [Gongylonema pulchrum]|uniref:Outer membrane protein n=1 Tax=Gongylonema pulchrum TaxID=637853 RepID=A0A183DE12_9BILA|nr:unnamed protein product [Gongylonema pulchrum]